MPRKSSMKPISLEEEEEEEDDDAITAEEAQMRAAQLQKELEEQNKFDCLCDGVNGAISLVDAAFNGLLELKDELLMHGLPPSLLASLILTTGKLYRSITDLHTPVRELTRLVNIYSVPWEQKSEQLKKLHTDYESKQRQLNIAVRKLQLVDTASRRMEREKIVNNWERVFAKVSSAKTHGRRWKFMIEAFKKKVKEGFVFNEFELDDNSDDEDDYDQSDEEDNEEEQDDTVDKQTFMMSVITASPPQEDDTGSQPQGSELGSDADGIPSEVTESSGNAEEMSPELQLKPKRQGVKFGPVDEVVEKIVFKPEMKDASVWTNEPEYETRLVVRIHRPLEMRDDEDQDISCNLTLSNTTVKTGVLPLPSTVTEIPEKIETLPPIDEVEIGEAPTKPRPKAGRRKSIGFASKPVSPPLPSSPSKSKSIKPSSILKKIQSPSEEDVDKSKDENTENPTIDRKAYQEVSFDVPEHSNDSIKIAVLQGEKNNMVSISMLSLTEIDFENLPVKIEKESMQDLNEKQNENEESAENVDEKQEELKEEEIDESGIDTTEPIFVSLQGIKLGLGGHGHSEIGKLPVIFYLAKKEIKKYIDQESSTESIKELVKDVVGIDIDEISKDDLIQILSREYQDVCTSAMSFASSSSHKSGYIAAEELEAIQEQHDKELRGLQAEYEIKLQQLLSEMEQMQHVPTRSPMQMAVTSDQQAIAQEIAMLHDNQIPIEEELQFVPEKIAATLRRPKLPALPDWGAHLPKNVWVRMKMLTEEMIEKRQQLEARVRRQIAGNIEKKLASQYKLQRANNTIRGPLQDVSLPAVFMPSKTGNVYNPRAHMYFHPAGTAGDLRLSQPPSIFQLPPLPEKAKLSVVNLFDLSKNFQQNTSTDWLTRIASAAQTKGSRATTASKRASRLATPNTPAPTANIPAFDT